MHCAIQHVTGLADILLCMTNRACRLCALPVNGNVVNS